MKKIVKRRLKTLLKCYVILVLILLFVFMALFTKADFQERERMVAPLNRKIIDLRETILPESVLDSDTLEIQLQRRELIQKVCDKEGSAFNDKLDAYTLRHYFIVSRRARMIYCTIPKVGSSFLRRLFYKFDNPHIGSIFNISASDAHIIGRYDLSDKTFPEIHHLLKTYNTFLFVREPYRRIFSAYVDKLFSPNPLFWSFFGKVIVHKFRASPANKSLECGHDVTFKEFIDFLIFSQEKNQYKNDHFDSMYEMSKPCQIDYKFIGKMETFEQDVKSIMTLANVTDTSMFDHLSDDYNLDQVRDVVSHLFERRNNYIKCMTLKEAMKRVWFAMQIRGIFSKDLEFPNELSKEDLNKENILKEFMKANLESGEARKQNRRESMIEAYSTIAEDKMERLKAIVKPDCSLFGYDPEPEDIFKTKSLNTQHWKYFP